MITKVATLCALFAAIEPAHGVCKEELHQYQIAAVQLATSGSQACASVCTAAQGASACFKKACDDGVEDKDGNTPDIQGTCTKDIQTPLSTLSTPAGRNLCKTHCDVKCTDIPQDCSGGSSTGVIVVVII
eukprot:SAG25_NODE_6801_length_528_cov_1.648019_1_plen_129_part_01